MAELTDYIKLLESVCASARDGVDFPYEQAAAAIAVAEVLQNRFGSSEITQDLNDWYSEPSAAEVSSLALVDWGTPGTLQQLCPTSASLFHHCIGLLGQLDALAKHMVAIDDGEPRTVRVGPPFNHDLVIALRPSRALADLVRHGRARAAQLDSPPNQYPPSIAQSLLHIATWATSHTGVDVCRAPVDLEHGAFAGATDDLARRDYVIALCPLTTSCMTRFVSGFGANGDRFRVDQASPLTSEARLWQHLDTIGLELADAKARLVLLPELVVPAQISVPFSKQISSRSHGGCLFFAGSFHVPSSNGQPPVNRMPVVDDQDVLYHHDKRGFFKINHQHLEAMKGWKHIFRVPPATGEHQSYIEDIRFGAQVATIESELGRLVGVICADGLEPMELKQALLDLRPDLLLVASMSMKTAAFERLATELAERHGGMAFANARPVCKVGELLAMLRLPIPHTVEGSVPAWIRWVEGSNFPEAHHPKEGWQRVSDPKAAWVTPGGVLMVNLAYWWRVTC